MRYVLRHLDCFPGRHFPRHVLAVSALLALSACVVPPPVEFVPVTPALFCTRSLANVDCWSNPWALNDGPPRGVADPAWLPPTTQFPPYPLPLLPIPPAAGPFGFVP